jgi:dolichol-phosphate mannosyltransferase
MSSEFDNPSGIPDVSVVICTLNEHEAIAGVLGDVTASLAGCSHEIIVVDDSKDERTADAVRDFAARHDGVRLLRRRNGRGLASAAIEGWDRARGRTLALMDGDGQHDPQLVARMLAARGEADVVIASRYLASDESGLCRTRHLLSCGGVGLTRALLGLQLADPMSGCFLMTRQWYQNARPSLSGMGFKILLDVLAPPAIARPRIVQIPTCLRSRAGGESKLDLRVLLELGAQLFEKATRGRVSARAALFFGVGLSGLLVHLSVLCAAGGLQLPFWLAQLVAISLAMTWNFEFNNLLTFRDRRLTGLRRWHGLAMFYASCLSGAIVSETLGSALAAMGASFLLAGTAGALFAGVWNYQIATRTAWRKREHASIATIIEAEIGAAALEK